MYLMLFLCFHLYLYINVYIQMSQLFLCTNIFAYVQIILKLNTLALVL